MFDRLVRLIKCCSEATQVKQADLYICECGLGTDRYLGNLLIHQYGKAAAAAGGGGLDEAQLVFHRITNRNIFSWGTLLTSYMSNKCLEHAWAVFNLMPHHSQLCYSCMAAAHAQAGHLDDVLGLFHSMPERDLVTWTALLQAYAQNGHHPWATAVYHAMPMHDLVSANSGISLHAQSGHLEEAVKLFLTMPEMSVVSCSVMVTAFAANGDGQAAKSMFDVIPSELGLRNVITWNSVLSAYASHRDDERNQANKVFELMPERSLASWNTILAAYPLNRAMQAFHSEMPERNHISWNTIITSNAEAALLSSTFESASGFAESTHELLSIMPAWDVLSWTSTMTAMVVLGWSDRVNSLFHEMPNRNEVAWSLLVQAFAQQHQIPQWRQAEQAFDIMPHHNFVSSTCIITMFSRLGKPEKSRAAFQAMKHHDLISWSALITAFAHNGLELDAIHHFHLMLLHGFQPDHVCFGGLLLACSHLGMVDVSVEHYQSMNVDHGVGATNEHFSCMVDVLGRAGLVRQAESLLNSMPELSSPVARVSLLAASRRSQDMECAARVAQILFNQSSSPSCLSSPYILLSNLYAAAGRQEDRAIVTGAMQEVSGRKQQQQQGTSCIEIDGQVHQFRVGDIHPEERFQISLAAIRDLMSEEDTTDECLHDVEMKAKKELLNLHSEKLAIAYGLSTTEPGTALTIFNNLRICSHCHTAAKRVSAANHRKIIIRDASRFHHFVNGSCTCNDYW